MTNDTESTKTDHEATLALLRRQPPSSRLRVHRRRVLRRREVRAQALGVGEQLLGVRRCGAGADREGCNGETVIREVLH